MAVTLEGAAATARKPVPPEAVCLRRAPALPWRNMRVLFGALFAMACAARSPEPKAVPPARVDVPRIVVTPTSTLTLEELFAEAQVAADRGDFAGAAERFDRIVALEPHGEL